MMMTNSFCNNLNSREQACFDAVCKWRRVEIKKQWVETSIPSFLIVKDKTLSIILLKIIFMPVFFMAFISKFIWETIALPFSIAATYLSPMNIEGTGERNLQGIHHRFVPYVSLSPQYYICCVNDWVEILYGKPEALRYSLREYIDPAMVQHIQSLYGDDINLHTRHILADAREKLSRRLGNY